MYPVLFEIGGINVYAYGAMISLAVLVATVAMCREAPRIGLTPEHILELVIVASVAGLLGSRLLYVFMNWDYYSEHLLQIFFGRYMGLSFYGAFLGGLFATWIWCSRRKIGFFRLADLAAPYFILGYAFGRIGCFLNGCCYGKVAEVPWALPVSMADNLLRHPVQLYAAGGAVLIFIILKLLQPVRPFNGFILFLLALLYGLLRFTTEFFREEPQVWHNLTAAQLFSAGLVLLSLIIIMVVLLAGRRRTAK